MENVEQGAVLINNPIQGVQSPLDLPEILECILFHFSTQQLLSARSVSKAWGSTANQLLITNKSHISNVSIHLGPGHSGPSTSFSHSVQEFLVLSNSPLSTPFFQQLSHFIIHGHSYNVSTGGPAFTGRRHYIELFTKYSQYITCIECTDYSDETVIEFILCKQNLSKFPHLQSLKISGNITTKFLNGPSFDIHQIARISKLEFGGMNDFHGQRLILEKLKFPNLQVTTNLSSIMFGNESDGESRNMNFECPHNLEPIILRQLFENSPKLAVFHNYVGELRSMASEGRFWMRNPHLEVMTTTACRLKDLKLMMTSPFPGSGEAGIRQETMYEFFTSHSTSLERLSVRSPRYVPSSNRNYLKLFNNLPELPALAWLELSDIPNTNFLASMPVLSKLRLIEVIPSLCLQQNFNAQVKCLSLKSLTLELLPCNSSYIDSDYDLKAHVNLVVQLTASFPNLQQFILQINKLERVHDSQTMRIELYLNKCGMEEEFKYSSAIEEIQFDQLRTGDLSDLESLKNFIEKFVNIPLTNCTKFMALDEHNKPMRNIPNLALVCLLSHGLTYKDIKLGGSKSATTNQRLGKYGFMQLSEPPSEPVLLRTFVIGPRRTSRDTNTNNNNNKVLF